MSFVYSPYLGRYVRKFTSPIESTYPPLAVLFTCIDKTTQTPIQGVAVTVYSMSGYGGEFVSGLTNINGQVSLWMPVMWSWTAEKTGYVKMYRDSQPAGTMNIYMQSTIPTYYANIQPSGSGTVSATVNGSPVDTTQLIWLVSTDILKITAVPNSGNNLANWRINGVDKPATNPLSLSITQNTTIYAVFTTLYTLTIIAGTGGTTNPVPGNYASVEGQSWTVTMIPSSGYIIDHWNLNGLAIGWNSNAIQFTTTQPNTLLEAVFKTGTLPPGNKYNLIVTSNPVNGGTTTPSGTTQVDPNTKVKVTANASTGYVFDYWTVNGQDSSSGNPIEVTVDRANFTVVAHFKSGTGWPFERTISLCVSQVVKAEAWDLLGKYIELPTFNVGDYEKYLGAKLQYTIQNRDSVNTIWQPDATIDMNGANVVKIIQVSQGTVKSGEVDVSTLLNKTGNKVKLGQSNLPGNWSEFVYTVKAVIGYSEKPKIDPGFDPSLLNLQWWQWGIIGGVVIFGAWTVLSKKGYVPSPTIIITQPYEYVKERLEERKR